MKQHEHCISPQKYYPSTKVNEITRFNKISFGKGERTKFEATSTLITIYLKYIISLLIFIIFIIR